MSIDLHHHKRQGEYTKRVLTADFELAVSRNLHPHMNKINSPNEARKKKIDDMSGVCQQKQPASETHKTAIGNTYMPQKNARQQVRDIFTYHGEEKY